MKVSKPKSLVARLVTAGTAGLVIAIGLFAILFHVVDVPFEPGPVYKPERINFTRQIVTRPPTIDDPRPPKPDKPDMTEIQTPTVTADDPETVDSPIDFGGVPNVSQFDPSEFREGPGRIGGVVYTGGTDHEATKIVGIPPEYPARELIRGTEGWVRVRYTITSTGSVRDAFVVSGEPRGVFDEAALNAVGRWRYTPRIVDGVGIERVGVETLIEFQLTE